MQRLPPLSNLHTYFHIRGAIYVSYASYAALFWVTVIIAFVFHNHHHHLLLLRPWLGLLTCSGIDALPSFPGASTISTSSRYSIITCKFSVLNFQCAIYEDRKYLQRMSHLFRMLWMYIYHCVLFCVSVLGTELPEYDVTNRLTVLESKDRLFAAELSYM